MMLIKYALKKRDVDPEKSRQSFPLEFVLQAWGAGVPKPRGRSSNSDEAKARHDEKVRVAAEASHSELAFVCEAFALTLDVPKQPKSEPEQFTELLRKIQDGAEQVADAADVLAGQLLKQYLETGSTCRGALDWHRLAALQTFAFALNGNFRDHVSDRDFTAMIMPYPQTRNGDHRMRHGLEGCRSLHLRAKRVISEYNDRADFLRSKGEPALIMKPGRRSDRNRDAFIIDLGSIYERHIGTPKAHRGNSGSGSSASPFVRFVRLIFEEVGTQAQIPITRDFLPKVDTIGAALSRG